MIMNSKFRFFLLVLSVLACHACKEDEPLIKPVDGSLMNGVFITNEGNFGNGTGTLSFIHRDGSGARQKVYQAANANEQLGNIVQSMHIIGDKAFIVVNNANKIVVANALTMKGTAKIDGIQQPRFILNNDSLIFVSCWDNQVKAFGFDGYQQVQAWTTGTGPEKMHWVNNEIWVLNQGGLSVDSTITIINPQNDATQTLAVYPRPTGIRVDKNGKVWVMCSGRLAYHPGGVSAGHLICIDPLDHTIIHDVIFPWTEKHPENLEISSAGDVMYYVYPGGISKIGIGDEFPPVHPLINYSGNIYTMAYDPVEHMIYTSDALDYVQNGRIYKYSAEDGSLQFSFSAGLIPGGFYFTPDI